MRPIKIDITNLRQCKFLNLRFAPINSLETSDFGGLIMLILCGTKI